MVPVARGVARDRRFRALGGEIGALRRRALLREDGELVSWVERFVVGVVLVCVARSIAQVQRRPMTISTGTRGRWGQLAEGEEEDDCAWVAREA